MLALKLVCKHSVKKKYGIELFKMKKTLILILLSTFFCKVGFAESYYFKECKLSEAVSGNYLIDFEKNLINVTLEASDGTVQKYIDSIKLVTKDRVVSEIIQQKNKKFATQYFLDVNSKSVIRQLYEREIAIDLIRPKGAPTKGYCANVKADWHKSKECPYWKIPSRWYFGRTGRDGWP